MIRKAAQKLKSFLTAPRRWGHPLFMTAFIVVFLTGYNVTSSNLQQCSAQTTTVGTAFCGSTCTGGFVLCDWPGQTSDIVDDLIDYFYDLLSDSAETVEVHLNALVHNMMEALLTRLNEIELAMISWWKTMWYYNLQPAMQAMTRQMNTTITESVQALGPVTDVSNESAVMHEHRLQQVKEHRESQPSENGCVAATVVGGYGRANTFSRAMREAWENESLVPGLNQKGSLGASSAVETEAKRYEEYKQTFCDPDGNGGRNNCPGTAQQEYYNADTMPTKFIYNQLTIDVQTPEVAKTIETINNNMMNVPSADPVTAGALDSADGKKNLLDRRAYLARYAALRTVPHMVTGWRMPGSGPQMAQWVQALREGAGVPAGSLISANPSYKEIMHAMSVDRFNSGKYASGVLTNVTGIEMEKLTLNAFYLMQLRDYYELLERTALTLAVQVSILAEEAPLPRPVAVAPLK